MVRQAKITEELVPSRIQIVFKYSMPNNVRCQKEQTIIIVIIIIMIITMMTVATRIFR